MIFTLRIIQRQSFYTTAIFLQEYQLPNGWLNLFAWQFFSVPWNLYRRYDVKNPKRNFIRPPLLPHVSFVPTGTRLLATLTHYLRDRHDRRSVGNQRTPISRKFYTDQEWLFAASYCVCDSKFLNHTFYYIFMELKICSAQLYYYKTYITLWHINFDWTKENEKQMNSLILM